VRREVENGVPKGKVVYDTTNKHVKNACLRANFSYPDWGFLKLERDPGLMRTPRTPSG
jgi:hypothetical protein